MADTRAIANLTPEQWDDQFFTEYLTENRYAGEMGTNENNIIQDKEVLTKKKGAGLTDMQSLTLYANYIWNFTEDFPLPPEFEDDAITELASLLLTDATS